MIKINRKNVQLIMIIGLCLFQISVYAQKTDTVYLINGDRITGELKKFEYGIVVLSTDGMSTINIEFDKIKTMDCSKFYEIVTSSGWSYLGNIKKSELMGNVEIVISNDTIPKPITEIVAITAIKNRFWKKFSGSLDLGVSYYKSSDILQTYINGSLNYRSEKNYISLGLSSILTDQRTSDSADITKKNDLSLGLTHFFSGKWWGGINSKFQQNSELNLDHRLQLGIGAGYDIIHTNPIRVYSMGGLLVNQEKALDSTSSSNNMEGIMSIKFIWHQYRHPKVNISSNFDAYPSLTIKERIRLEYDLSVKYEIVNDLYVNFTLYDSFDSKPTGGGPALNDWGGMISIGYSF